MSVSPPGRRLLVITYHFPPDPSVGALRWDAMSRWLRRLGHEVTVLTTRGFGTPTDDGPETRRSFDLAESHLLRRLLGRPPLPATGPPQPADKPPSAILSDVLVPDAHLLGWNPSAAWAARRLVRERRIECVITSSPPQSTHLIPFALGRGRPAWIADFRDGWRFDPLRGPWRTRAQQALDARLERWVVGRADEVIGVTRPIAEDLGARLGGRSVHVPNGWDPDLDPSSAKSSLTLEPNTVSIVYTGTLGGEGAGRRDPGVLLAALEQLLPRRPDAADRLRIILVGPVESRLRRLLADFDGGAMISCLGQLPREQALLAQRQADALLLLTAPGHVSQATGKVFEYLAAGRPIIALADRNEAARLIEETGTGVTVKQDDAEGLAGVLEQALDDRLGEQFAPHDLEQYVYPGPAEAVAELVEKAVARRTRAGR